MRGQIGRHANEILKKKSHEKGRKNDMKEGVEKNI